MPFYEYRCRACGHQDTFLENFDAPKNKTCPECKKRQAFERLISAAGFQLKGDGWYVTDFKNKPSKDKPSKDKPEKVAKADGDGGGDKTDKAATAEKAPASA